MASSLTPGSVSRICSLGRKEDDWNPVVQVIDLRLVNAAGAPSTGSNERYRVRISDGRHWQQGMLALQLNSFVQAGKLQRGSLIKLLDIVATTVQSRLIILIVSMEVVLQTCDIIGQPEALPKSLTSPSPGSVDGHHESMGGGGIPFVGAGNETGIPSSDHPGVNSRSSMGSPYPTNARHGSTNPPSMNRSYNFQNAAIGDPPPQSGSYGNQNLGVRDSTLAGEPYSSRNQGFHNSRPDFSRTPPKSHGRSPQSAAYQQPPPMYSNPVSRNEAPARIVPISALNPYQGRWTIKARVTSKGELRHYNNPRGEGKVFSFDLLDSEGGEIRATCFNAVADQFYNQIDVGKVYTISRGSLKPAQKTFNHLRNDQEIFLESTSVIQPCFDDDSSIPRVQFHFCSIGDIEGMENNAVVDFIGVVSSINPAGTLMRKNGTETQKRTLQLKDVSRRCVELTLWGGFCSAEGQRLQNMCDSGLFPVLAVKSGRISDFNGKSVGTISTSQLFIEPEFPEAFKLREWFDREGKNAPSVSISREAGNSVRVDNRKTISQIKDENLGTSEKPDWIQVSATVSFIKVDNFCYTACPLISNERQCNKKVTNNGDGKWRCDRCDQSVDECDYRYILQLQIQDHTGLTWVTAFQEGGEEVMGVPAKVLYNLKFEEQDDVKFAEIVRKVLFTKFMFKLKVKEEVYNDEQRVKSTVAKAERVNYTSESRFLLDQMEKLRAEDSGSAPPKAENSIPKAENSIPQASSGYNYQSGAPPKAENLIPKAENSIPQASSGYNYHSGSGREVGMQANQSAPYGNQFSTSRPSLTASSGYMTCNSCGAPGHNSVNCPSMSTSHGQSLGGAYGNRAPSGQGVGNDSNTCFKCHQTGHWARDCPGSRDPRSYGSGGAGVPGRYSSGGIPRQHVGGL